MCLELGHGETGYPAEATNTRSSGRSVESLSSLVTVVGYWE
jgi:hypothetical protein